MTDVLVPSSPVYLDHNSTSPVDPRVVEKMLPVLRHGFGNPASRDHAYGWDAQEAVEDARSEVAALIGAEAREIVFTSGATESIHLALKGLFPRDADAGGGLLVTAVEHEAVLGAARQLAARGIPLRSLAVDASGRIGPSSLAAALAEANPKVLAVMAANNETGVLFPLREIAAQAHGRRAVLFTDAVQALGRVPLDARADGFDLAALSAHKLHGPKGVGALYLSGGPEAWALEPLTAGGGQEKGIRPGTLNVPGIVGFGEACRLARLALVEEMGRIRALRDRLEAGLREGIPGVRVNGEGAPRLPNTTNALFPGVEARVLIRDMHDVAVSTRSACSSGLAEASHVLLAMGASSEEAESCIRFSLGRFTTEEEIDRTLGKVLGSYSRLRSLGRA